MTLFRPQNWFASARSVKRHIVVHQGPTNSSKTYNSLLRLKEASSGQYGGPLRLLAREVWNNLQAAGVPCNLFTGQEVIRRPGAQHASSTVEMLNTNRVTDVTVLDEIQMAGDKERGGAWTRALLGAPSKEIHVCGDHSATRLIRKMCRITGDTIEIRSYDRKTPLECDKRPMPASWSDLVPGDCVVAFSRSAVHSLKQRIESETAHRCAVVYGTLPPETRVEQARLFNSQDNDHTVLVATDAIGMGLTFNIGRVVFSTMTKFDGVTSRRLQATEVKQLAGRAGRYGTQFSSGRVTAMNQKDLNYIRQCLAVNLPAARSLRIDPPLELLEMTGLPLSEALKHFESPDMDLGAGLWQKVDVASQLHIAKELEACVQGANAVNGVNGAGQVDLATYHRFTQCPIRCDDERQLESLKAMFRQYTGTGAVSLRDLEPYMTMGRQALNGLEHNYAVLDAYYWLANRYHPRHFPDLPQVLGMKQNILQNIQQQL